MPDRAANLVIPYDGEGEGIQDSIEAIATDLGFHHHTTHNHGEELLFVFQPFEDSNQNKQLIIDCMNRIGQTLAEVNVSLRETGDTNHPDDPISTQYLLIVEEAAETDDIGVNVPNWLKGGSE